VCILTLTAVLGSSDSATDWHVFGMDDGLVEVRHPWPASIASLDQFLDSWLGDEPKPTADLRREPDVTYSEVACGEKETLHDSTSKKSTSHSTPAPPKGRATHPA
jgi:hypothetical protein